jgi:hypothetical protein
VAICCNPMYYFRTMGVLNMIPTRGCIPPGLILVIVAVLGGAGWSATRPVSNLHPVQAGENNTGASQDGATSSPTNGVTRSEQPPVGDHLTPEQMRQAKPFPMPSIDGPPVPQQTTPSPYTGPAGSSPPGLPGLGGAAHR